MKKQIFLIVLLLTLININFIYAEKINTNLSLDIQCSNSTYLNVSYVKNIYTNTYLINTETSLTKNGIYYNYIIDSSVNNISGILEVGYHCDLNGIDQGFGYKINVTPTGDSNNLGFYIILTVIILGLLLIGIFIKNIPLTMIGSLCSVAWGVYTVIFGFNSFINVGTQIFSISILGFGFYWGFQAMGEYLDLL